MRQFAQLVPVLQLSGIILSLAGVLFAPALASVGTTLLLVIGLLHFNWAQDKRHVPWTILVLWLMTASFIQGWTADTNRFLLLKLPVLFIPFLAASFRVMKAGVMLIAIAASIWLFYAAAMASIFVYLQDPHWYHQLVLESKPMPVLAKMHHIEFSLYLACSGWAGLYLWSIKLNHPGLNVLRWFTILAAFLNILLLHFLSARTGLLAFYVGLAIWWIWMYRQRWKQMILGGLALISVLALASIWVPSLRNRVLNTYDDLRTVTGKADPNDKSFAQRWEAWKASIYLMGEQPLLGWGMKELAPELSRAHEAMGSEVLPWNRKMPHNQFLETGIQGGLTALLLLLLGLFYWFKDAVNTGNTFLLSILGMLIAAFTFESLLEQQSGVLWSVLWPILAAYILGKNIKNPEPLHQ
ncbi:MAG: hypothetical protein RL160_674 [Bacteroidota bacterium]